MIEPIKTLEEYAVEEKELLKQLAAVREKKNQILEARKNDVFALFLQALDALSLDLDNIIIIDGGDEYYTEVTKVVIEEGSLVFKTRIRPY